MLIFRDFELDFDIFDADNAEVYEAALSRVVDAANAKPKDESFADGIRRQCQAVFDFFDEVLGEGFHREIFGDRTNFNTCLTAFKEFTNAVNVQRDENLAKVRELMPSAQPNRAARRAVSRAKKTE